MPPKLPFCLFALALCLPLPAQVQNRAFFPDSNPATGGQNSLPFGQQGARLQQILPGSLLQPGDVVQDLYLAPFGSMLSLNTGGEIVFGDIELRLGPTPLAAASTSWTANNPAPVVVHRGRMRQRWLRDTWTPIGLDRPFVWNPTYPGDNLCIEVIVWNVQDTGNLPNVPGFFAVRTGSLGRAFRADWTTNPGAPPQVSTTGGFKVGLLRNDGNFVPRGVGCPGGNGLRPALSARGWPRLGSLFAADLTGLAPNALALPFLGFDEVGSGPRSWPFDLGVAGAPGCRLWHEPLAVLPPQAAGSGSGAITVPVLLSLPNRPSLLGMRARLSALILDPGARGGLATSDYALLILGS